MTIRALAAVVVLCVSAQATDFITSVSTGAFSRSDATAYLGFHFIVGASPISVTALGRWCKSGNSLTHVLYVTSLPSNAIQATVTVNMAGCTVGTFVYASASCTLAAGGDYFISSAELNGGDTWWDTSQLTFTSTAVAVPRGGVYDLTVPPAAPIAPNYGTTPAYNSYVPVSFRYSTGGGNSQAIIF